MSRRRTINSQMPSQPTDGATQNSLGGALGFNGSIGIGGGINPMGFPGQGYNTNAPQISQSNGLFKNMRWYLISNFRQMLSQAYVEIDLIQTIVDIPVDDGLRGGVQLKSQQLSEDQIEQLQVSLDHDNDLATAGQAAKWNRLFGGAGIMVFTDQHPSSPLNIPAINADTNLEFRAVDMWELFGDKQNVEGWQPGESADADFYNYYGTKVHASRVMLLKGLTAPSFVRPRLRGWGFSVVETLVRAINQYLKATDLSFEVLDEFKLDVYKIKNLVNTLLSPNGQQKIMERVRLANWQKNYQNAVVMDSEDDFDHKQLSFAGLSDAMAGIRMQVASAMRMPLTKLFGISAAGFNSGEDDIEVYNAMVESQVRGKLKYDILRMCEIKCQKLFGMVPDDLSVSFEPLRVLSAEQEENVKTQKFTRLMQAKQAGELTTEEFRDACNKGDLFDITLDTSDSVLDDLADEAATDAALEGMGNPGANREDSQKSITGVGSVKKGDAPEAKSAKEPKQSNAIPSQYERAWYICAPLTTLQRIERILKNSAEFDRKSYEADGGDAWIDPRRQEFFMNPGTVDEALWAKAKEASHKAFGKEKWQFVTWWYKKQGGKFS